MKEFIERLLKIDRRIIFLALAVALFFPIVRPLGLPNKEAGNEVKAFYNTIESLPPGSFIYLSVDFDPATRPELYPQVVGLLRQAFRKNCRVMIVTLISGATGIVDELAERIPRDIAPGKVNGTDYVVMPFQPNPVAIMTQIGMDIYQIYDKDRDGKPVKDMPVMKGIRNVKDMQLGVSITGTAILSYYVAYTADKYKFPFIGGVTAVSQMDYAPYLQTGQLKGLIGGMKGAADYELLLGAKEKGAAGLDALSLAHVMVIALIIMANIMMIVLKYL